MIVFILGTLAILIFLAWATRRSGLLLKDIPAGVNVLLLPEENGLRLVLIAICIGLGMVSGLSPGQLGWVAPEVSHDVILGVVFGAAAAAVVPPLTRLAVQRWGKQVYSPAVLRIIIPRRPAEWLLVPLALISSVFLEELLFRSLLLGGFGFFLSPAILAVVWSLIFGAMHLPQGVLGVVVASGLGLALSALFLVTQSLVTPFAAHYVIDLLQLLWASRDKSWLEANEGAGSHS